MTDLRSACAVQWCTETHEYDSPDAPHHRALLGKRRVGATTVTAMLRWAENTTGRDVLPHLSVFLVSPDGENDLDMSGLEAGTWARLLAGINGSPWLIGILTDAALLLAPHEENDALPHRIADRAGAVPVRLAPDVSVALETGVGESTAPKVYLSRGGSGFSLTPGEAAQVAIELWTLAAHAQTRRAS